MMDQKNLDREVINIGQMKNLLRKSIAEICSNVSGLMLNLSIKKIDHRSKHALCSADKAEDY